MTSGANPPIFGHIYLAQCANDGPVKIGVSADPVRRMGELRHPDAGQPELLSVIPNGGMTVEWFLHRRLADHLLGPGREWYRPCDDVFDTFEALRPLDERQRCQFLKEPQMIQDANWMLDELRRGPATTSELIDRSKAERGVRLTPHSRAADLRKRGYDIQVSRRPNPAGRRPVYEYTLVGERAVVEPRASVGQGQPWADSPATAPPDVIPGQLRLVG